MKKNPRRQETQIPTQEATVQDFTGETMQIEDEKMCCAAEIEERITALVESCGGANHPALIRQMIETVLGMSHDPISVADLKLINRSLTELRDAARVFAPYTDRRKIAVFGSARTDPTAAEFMAAEEFSARMRERGYMIVTGGGDGIMGAAQRGAGREESFGLNILLPFEQRANVTIDGDHKLVNFKYFFTRKLNFVKETHAIALFPGGFGTMDEGFECLTLMQTGKARIIPMVVVDKPGGQYWKAWEDFNRKHLLGNGLISEEDFHFFKLTNNLDEAVEEVCRFYRVYHSFRYVGRQMVFRLNHALAPEKVAALNSEFGDLLAEGKFEMGKALRQERNEAQLADLPRLIFTPHRRNFGRIRLLIDRINED